MPKQFVLFDFDGVIADSFQPAFEVQKMICPHLDKDSYRTLFEGNINDWEDPMHGHGAGCRHDIDFFTQYIPRMMQEIKIVPGIDEVIIALEKSYGLIVVSSNITSPIREFLESHGLAAHFLQIMGNDVHASKVEKMKMVFEQYDTTPKNCVFITDTLGDLREAIKAGVGTIGVLWGFHDRERLSRGNPFRLVEKPQDLMSAVLEYFSKSHN